MAMFEFGNCVHAAVRVIKFVGSSRSETRTTNASWGVALVQLICSIGGTLPMAFQDAGPVGPRSRHNHQGQGQICGVLVLYYRSTPFTTKCVTSTTLPATCAGAAVGLTASVGLLLPLLHPAATAPAHCTARRAGP